MRSSDPREALSLRDLAGLLASMLRLDLADRELITQLLRRVLENQPGILGAWCLFESEIFGGDDPEFAGAPGHDERGRFIPRWERSHGTPQLSANFGHDSATLGGWYSLTRDCREEIVFGPYDEGMLSGFPVLGLCRVAPILERDRFLGVVGLDISLDALLSARDENSVLENRFQRWHVFLDEKGAILHAGRDARRLLTRYVGPSRGLQLPTALRSALSQEDILAELIYRQDRDQLRVHIVRHPYSGRRILSLEEKRHTKAQTVLSKREQEVFRWLEQGKTNGEIALILGISEHTVRHHLERIFARLGVENRTAAIRFGRQVARAAGSRPVSFVPPPWDGPPIAATPKTK